MSRLVNWLAIGLLLIAVFETVLIDRLYTDLLVAMHEIQQLSSDDSPDTKQTRWINKPSYGVLVEQRVSARK